MRVFGIDCGTEVTGYGVVESDDSGRQPRLVMKAMGAIRLSKSKPLPVRLEQVFRELSAELQLWKPDAVAIEEVFYSVNAKSALKLGQVRGVALLAAATLGLPVAEYAPLTIKSSVVGYGLAKKEQVQFMVARLLELSEAPQSADTADALAIAICHIHTAQTLALQGGARHCPALAWGGRSGCPGGFFQPWTDPVALDADHSPGRQRAFPLRVGQCHGHSSPNLRLNQT